MKKLVVYYSRKGENFFPGGIKSVEKGNTEYAAEYIAKAVVTEGLSVRGHQVQEAEGMIAEWAKSVLA